MTAKEFLERVMIAQLEVEARLEQIARLQVMATQTTLTLKSVVSHGNKVGSSIENLVLELPEQIWKLEKEISEFVEVRSQATEVISSMENYNERILIEYRYLCLLSWRQIARIMNFSLDHVFKIHRQALRNFPVPKTRQ